MQPQLKTSVTVYINKINHKRNRQHSNKQISNNKNLNKLIDNKILLPILYIVLLTSKVEHCYSSENIPKPNY